MKTKVDRNRQARLVETIQNFMFESMKIPVRKSTKRKHLDLMAVFMINNLQKNGYRFIDRQGNKIKTDYIINMTTG